MMVYNQYKVGYALSDLPDLESKVSGETEALNVSIICSFLSRVLCVLSQIVSDQHG